MTREFGVFCMDGLPHRAHHGSEPRVIWAYAAPIWSYAAFEHLAFRMTVRGLAAGVRVGRAMTTLSSIGARLRAPEPVMAGLVPGIHVGRRLKCFRQRHHTTAWIAGTELGHDGKRRRKTHQKP